MKSSPGERILDFTVNILCTKFIVHYFSRYSTTVIRFEEFFFTLSSERNEKWVRNDVFPYDELLGRDSTSAGEISVSVCPPAFMGDFAG